MYVRAIFEQFFIDYLQVSFLCFFHMSIFGLATCIVGVRTADLMSHDTRGIVIRREGADGP